MSVGVNVTVTAHTPGNFIKTSIYRLFIQVKKQESYTTKTLKTQYYQFYGVCSEKKVYLS